MAVLRIELDIDSDVQPELHAVLARIAAASSRGERLRQLAGAALIYEGFRFQPQPVAAPAMASVPVIAAPVASPPVVVPAVVAPPAIMPPSPAQAAAAPSPIAPVEAVAPTAVVETAASTVSTASTQGAAPAEPMSELLLDDTLAHIDCSLDGPRAGEPDHEAEADRTVDASIDPAGDPANDAPTASAAELPAALAARIPVLQDVVELRAGKRQNPVAAPALPHAQERQGAQAAHPPDDRPSADIVPIAAPPATRSRLMRMKQKGLFNNG